MGQHAPSETIARRPGSDGLSQAACALALSQGILLHEGGEHNEGEEQETTNNRVQDQTFSRRTPVPAKVAVEVETDLLKRPFHHLVLCDGTTVGGLDRTVVGRAAEQRLEGLKLRYAHGHWLLEDEPLHNLCTTGHGEAAVIAVEGAVNAGPKGTHQVDRVGNGVVGAAMVRTCQSRHSLGPGQEQLLQHRVVLLPQVEQDAGHDDVIASQL
mmetsp:Transcript_45797/g.97815  ORF Transcript_45797/g.97815 Transcript_45797/m.97815 type:complete len:212 (+) Transcript_45797:105-740(+)